MQTMKADFNQSSPPTTQRASPTGAVSQLNQLRQQQGEQFTARVTQVTRDTTANPDQASRTSSAASGAGSTSASSSASGSAAYNSQGQTSQTSSQTTSAASPPQNQPPTRAQVNQQIWNVTLQAVSNGAQISTKMVTAQLPSLIAVGNTLEVKLQPEGLKILGPALSAAEKAAQPLSQALARWLPLQGPVQPSLQRIFQLADSSMLPRPLQTEVQQVVARFLPQQQVADPGSIKSAIQQSGLQMERQLAATLSGLLNSGSNIAAGRELPPHPHSSQPSLLQSPGNLAALLPSDLKAATLSALATVFQHLQQAGTQSTQTGLPQSWQSLATWMMKSPHDQVTGLQGANPLSPNAIAGPQAFSALHSGSEVADLLKALVQTLGKIHINQLNSLQHNLLNPPETGAPQVWLFDLPIANKRTDHVECRLEKEESKNTEEKKKRTRWRLLLAFDIEELGPFQSHVFFASGTVSATFWADRQTTLKTLTGELPHLRQRFEKWGIKVGEVLVRKGQPPRPQQPLTRQLIDEHA